MSILLNHPFYVKITYKDWDGVIQVPSVVEFGAQPQIFIGQFFELDLLMDIEGRLGFGKTFIDIGACMGNHSLFFAGPLKAKRVYAFEPVPLQVNLMEGTFLRNNITNVEILPYAAGDEDTNAEIMKLDPTHLGGSEIVHNPDGDIKMVRVDDALKNIDELHCIKIDAESSTGIAFRGCERLIERFKPIIYIEESPYESVQSTVDETAEELKYTRKDMFGIKGTNAAWRYEYAG